MYRIEFDNGVTIDRVSLSGGVYSCEEEVIGRVEGVREVTIKTDDGCEKRIKRAKIEDRGRANGVNRFMIRELTKEERAEESRKKKLDSQNEWIKERYDRVSVTLPKGTKERITGLGESVNGFINEAVARMLDEVAQ